MKLCHIVPTYYPAVRYGGPILAIHSLCKSLVELGHDVTVITTNVDSEKDMAVPLDQPVLIDGVKVFYYPSFFLRRWLFSWGMKRKIDQIISHMDFVHLHSLFLWPTFIAGRAALKYRIPYCIAPRGALVPELIKRKSQLKKKIAFMLYEEKNLEKASFIHATSLLEKDDITATKTQHQAIEVVENGVEINYFNKILPEKEFASDLLCLGFDSSYLLFLGRISWKKRIDKLIYALPYIHKEIKLVIAGYDDEGLCPSLKKVAQDLGQLDRIYFVGSVHGSQKQNLLSKSLALVLPSMHENFGNVILESWLQKRPVLLSRNIGLVKSMLDFNSGAIIPESPQAFGRLVNKLYANKALLNEMGENGFNLVTQKYTWIKKAQELASLYHKYSESHASQ